MNGNRSIILIELKKQYGDKLAFMGGIDVRAMRAEDPAVIEEEIRTKVGFAKQDGYIPLRSFCAG